MSNEYDSSDSLILEGDIPGPDDLFDLSDGESLQEDESLDGYESDDISDLDDNIEEIYLDDDSESEDEEGSEEEDSDIDIDLEEVTLENSDSGEMKNLMNGIDELKNIAFEKNLQSSEINLEA